MVGCLHKRENGSFHSQVPEMVSKLKRFTPNETTKGPTVTIAKSGNYVFGEFAEISWESKYVSCDRVKYWYFWSHLASLNIYF